MDDGNTSIERLISRGIPLTFYSQQSVIRRDLRFLTKAIGRNRKPGLINIDKSGANAVAIKQYNQDNNKRIKIRQRKYLKNIVEQDHRKLKRITRPMMGFKNFHATQQTLTGIEVMAMIKKGQMKTTKGDNRSPAELFYAIAA